MDLNKMTAEVNGHTTDFTFGEATDRRAKGAVELRVSDGANSCVAWMSQDDVRRLIMRLELLAGGGLMPKPIENAPLGPQFGPLPEGREGDVIATPTRAYEWLPAKHYWWDRLAPEGEEENYKPGHRFPNQWWKWAAVRGRYVDSRAQAAAFAEWRKTEECECDG